MKRVFALLLALCAVFCLFSCSEQKEDGVPEGMAVCRNAFLDLRVFYPENWSVSENGESVKLTSAEQNSLESQMSAEDVTDGAAILPSNVGNVSVYRIREDVEDLKSYAEGEWRASFSASFVFDPAVSEGKIGQDPSYTVNYHFASKGGEVLYRFSQTLVLHKGSVYALAFSATPELYDLLRPSFSDICKSIVFEEIAEEDNTALSSPVDATVPEDAAKISEREGMKALTNKGVPYILYYPEGEVWQVAADTGYLALRAESGASVSVVRGDAYAAQIQTPEDYLDRQYYPSFDALYGTHTELSRKELAREDSVFGIEVTFTAVIEGEEFTFVQALYMKQGYLYTLLYTAKSAEYETYLPAVELMISNFTFKA